MNTDNALIPDQTEGTEKNFEHVSNAPDCDAADRSFLIAKDRLLHPGKWHELAGAATATFHLTDVTGSELTRPARKGDYMRISIPGPDGSRKADGDDWVHIEQIIYETDPDADTERISMLVRPCSAPVTPSEEVHHFFSRTATSTFVISRNRCVLTASIHGRNEKPNTSSDSLLDKARNALVAVGAIAGAADLQWNALVKGLLSFEEDSHK